MTTGKPKLTAKQERFCELVALEGMTQANAYRGAYDAKGMTDKQIWEKSSELAANGKVSERIESLKAEIAAKTVEKELWSRVDSITVLKDIATDHEARGNEKVSAVKELNAMHGFSVTKVEHSGDIELRGEFELYLQAKKVADELTDGQICRASIASVHRTMHEIPEEVAGELVSLLRDIAQVVAKTKARDELVKACQKVLSDLEGYVFD